jgi:hypothetical protein
MDMHLPSEGAGGAAQLLREQVNLPPFGAASIPTEFAIRIVGLYRMSGGHHTKFTDHCRTIDDRRRLPGFYWTRDIAAFCEPEFEQLYKSAALLE